jgi:hypothetical protein
MASLRVGYCSLNPFCIESFVWKKKNIAAGNSLQSENPADIFATNVCQTCLPMGRFAFKQMRFRFVHKDVEYCQVIQVAVLMRQLDLV